MRTLGNEREASTERQLQSRPHAVRHAVRIELNSLKKINLDGGGEETLATASNARFIRNKPEATPKPQRKLESHKNFRRIVNLTETEGVHFLDCNIAKVDEVQYRVGTHTTPQIVSQIRTFSDAPSAFKYSFQGDPNLEHNSPPHDPARSTLTSKPDPARSTRTSKFDVVEEVTEEVVDDVSLDSTLLRRIVAEHDILLNWHPLDNTKLRRKDDEHDEQYREYSVTTTPMYRHQNGLLVRSFATDLVHNIIQVCLNCASVSAILRKNNFFHSVEDRSVKIDNIKDKEEEEIDKFSLGLMIPLQITDNPVVFPPSFESFFDDRSDNRNTFPQSSCVGIDETADLLDTFVYGRDSSVESKEFTKSHNDKKKEVPLRVPLRVSTSKFQCSAGLDGGVGLRAAIMSSPISSSAESTVSFGSPQPPKNPQPSRRNRISKKLT